jgi:hypothetical protein
MRIMQGSDSRYLTKEEQDEITRYCTGLVERLKYSAMIEAKEQAAVKATIDEMRRRYPNFDKFHDQAWGKAFRDTQLTVRYCVQAMILDDIKPLEDKLLYWFRTILASFSFTPGFNRDNYTLLTEAFRRQLPPEAFRALEPYLNRVTEIMSDFPEPAVPAV